MGEYQLLSKAAPPETGYVPVEGAEFDSLDEAIVAAQDRLLEAGRVDQCYIERQGTNEVTSVGYHPGEVLGAVDGPEGPVISRDTTTERFKIVHDGREQKVKATEQVDDETGEKTTVFEVGGLAGKLDIEVVKVADMKAEEEPDGDPQD